MTNQTRLVSLIESLTNTGVGFIISLITWSMIRWSDHYDIQTTAVEGVEITLIFTVVSIARGYVLRRVFIQYHHWLQEMFK